MPGKQTSEAYDIVLSDPADPEHPIGLMLARPPGPRSLTVAQAFEPTELGSVSPPRPVPVVWDRWLGGAGVAKPMSERRGAYRIARNACTRYGRVVTPAGGLHEYSLASVGVAPAVVNGFAAIGDVVLVLTSDNRPLIIRAGGDGPVDQATTLEAGFRCEDATMFAGALWISGGGGPSIVRFDGGTWQQSPAGAVARSRVAAVTWTRGGTPRRRLVATTTTGDAIVYTTGDNPHDPAHWSASVPVESAWPLQRLVAGPRHVYGIGPGGVFDLTENGETPIITGETWGKNYDPSAGAAGVLYDGRMVVAGNFGTYMVGLNGQLVDIMEDVSIGALQPAEIPVGGRPRALFVLDGWLAQATYTASTGTSQLWFGMRSERINPEALWPVTWHGSECDLPRLEVTAAAVVSPPGKKRRVVFGTRDVETGATRIFWQALPKYGSPIQDYRFGQEADRMDYARSWSIEMTAEDLGDPASMKDPLWWDVLGGHLGGPNRLTLSAAARDRQFVVQGTATTGDDRFGAQGVRDKTLSVTVEGANSESVPAVLEAVKGSWVVTVEESATQTVEVMFGQGVSLLDGSEDTVDADLTFARLLSLNQHTSVRAIRWDGVPLLVRVEQGLQRRWTESPDGQGWLAGAVINLTILSRPMIHDVGDLHDVGLRHDG